MEGGGGKGGGEKGGRDVKTGSGVNRVDLNPKP